MQQKRLQNVIAESRWLLPVVTPFAILIWGIVSLFDYSAIPSLVCLMFSTYLMIELNNENALIRIYSRMVSCCFMVFTTMATFQFISIRAAIVILCIAGFYTCAFRSYQQHTAQGWLFYAFLCIGISSIVWVHTLYLLPLLWLLLATNLLAASAKNYVASVLGVLLPNLLYVGYFLWNGNLDTFLAHYTALAEFETICNYELLSISQIITAAWIILCAIIGTSHCLIEKRNDNIRTRMLYGAFIAIAWFSIVFLCLQPQHFEALLGCIITSASPLIGHYFALTHSKLSNFTFKVIALGTIILTMYNLWAVLPNIF